MEWIKLVILFSLCSCASSYEFEILCINGHEYVIHRASCSESMAVLIDAEGYPSQCDEDEVYEK